MFSLHPRTPTHSKSEERALMRHRDIDAGYLLAIWAALDRMRAGEISVIRRYYERLEGFGRSLYAPYAALHRNSRSGRLARRLKEIALSCSELLRVAVHGAILAPGFLRQARILDRSLASATQPIVALRLASRPQ